MREMRVRVFGDVEDPNVLRPGDLIIRAGRTEVNGRFRELRYVRKGQRLLGPRGGRYDVTLHGEDVLVALVTSTRTPVVRRESFVTVLRDCE